MARILLVALLLNLAALALPAVKLRGLWVDVFHEGIKNPMQVRQLIERAKRANANALFIQVRSRAQVYHVSAYEHRAPDTTPLFDGLAEVIELAHAQTPPMQVHAWINAHPLWESKKDPPWADHVVLRHPEWLTKSIDGSTSTEVGRALDFGNPEAAEYLLRLYLEVVRNYDVDGVHLDFIRYTGTEWGYNAVSLRRFFESLSPKAREEVLKRSEAIANRSAAKINGEGSVFPGVEKQTGARGAPGLPATDDPRFSDWRRAQVTGFVRRLVYHVKSLKPRVLVSAAVIPWGDAPSDFKESAAYKRVFQDWKSWAEQGLLDLVVPMLYFREEQHGAWFRNWLNYCANINSKTPIAAGIGNWLNTHNDTLKQAKLADEKLAGVCFFSYASTNPAPGQEAEVFNENFYGRAGELGAATPLGPNTKGLFSFPATFGYRFDPELRTADDGFYVGPATNRQSQLTAEEAANLGILTVQVNRFARGAEPVFRHIDANISTAQSISVSDQVVTSVEGNRVTVSDVLGRSSAVAMLPSVPDVALMPGDVIALRGKVVGGQLLATTFKWLGVTLAYDKS
jgi:uncharacterized lipoprotein YddW (UPF0748 family)